MKHDSEYEYCVYEPMNNYTGNKGGEEDGRKMFAS